MHSATEPVAAKARPSAQNADLPPPAAGGDDGGRGAVMVEKVGRTPPENMAAKSTMLALTRISAGRRLLSGPLHPARFAVRTFSAPAAPAAPAAAARASLAASSLALAPHVPMLGLVGSLIAAAVGVSYLLSQKDAALAARLSELELKLVEKDVQLERVKASVHAKLLDFLTTGDFAPLREMLKAKAAP